MNSMTSDLMKFNNALFDFKVVKKEILDELLTPRLDDYGSSTRTK
jgi:hypothetical protein